MKIKILLVIILLINFVCLTEAQSSDKVLDITLSLKATEKEVLQFGDGILEPRFNYTNYTDFNVSLQGLKMNTLNREAVYIPEGNGHLFSVELISEDSKTINKFDLKENFFSDGGILDEINKNFVILYDEKVKYLKVKYNDKEKLFIDIQQLLCNNNNICDSTEDYYSCKTDCPLSSKDGSCISSEDKICDPDCIYDADCLVNSENNQKNNFLEKNLVVLFITFVGVAVFILLFVIIIITRIKKKKQS